jgi:Holliday junction resolvase
LRNVRRRNVRRARARDDAQRITEKDLQSTIVDLLHLYGWITYHTFDSRRSTPGFPDLVAIKGTRLLALELKSDLGKVTEEQYGWLRAFAGVTRVEAFVVRPENVDELNLIASM